MEGALELGRDEAGNNRDLVRRYVLSCQSLLFLFGRFWQLTSASAARCPHLRQEILTAIAVEDQLGVRLWPVYRRGRRYHHHGCLSFRVSDQQRGRAISPVSARRCNSWPGRAITTGLSDGGEPQAGSTCPYRTSAHRSFECAQFPSRRVTKRHWNEAQLAETASTKRLGIRMCVRKLDGRLLVLQS